ncbi:putative transcription factor bHLH family [Dioscorea sansibarensis]
MDLELRDTLRSLCHGHGWSYGVFWRISRGEPRFLIVAENYCEDQFKPVVKKMINQVNVVGEGTIGQVAASGEHQWIHSNGNSREWSTNGADNTPGMLQGNNEWCYQFLSGIKSMVFISVPSRGVVQFGSSQQIFEDFEFIDQVKSSFQKFTCMKGLHSEKNNKIHTPQYEFEAGISSGHFQACYRNIIDSMHESSSNDLFEKAQCSTNPIKAQSLYSIPSVSNSTCSTQQFSNPFQRTSSTRLTYQCDAAMLNSQLLLSPNTQLSHSSLSNDSDIICLNANAWNKEVNQSVMYQRLVSGMHSQGLSCTSHSSYSSTHTSCYHHLHGGSVSFSSLYRSLGASGEQLLDFHHASPSFPVIEGDSCTSISFSNPTTINNSNKELGSDESKFIPSKDDVVENDNKLDGISSSHVTCNEVGNSISGTMNSFDIGHYGKENCMSFVTNPLSDNDFFNGLEMDLNPSFLGQDSWGTITMPTDDNPVFSECFSDLGLDSNAGFDDKFFMEPAVEQLLDAVVNGNLNFDSGHNSVDTKQCSSSKSVAGAQGFGQASNVLFSDSNLGLGHGCLKETQTRSKVSSWMDDSTSMNAESAVTNLSKRLEEAPRVVRKRARPGESTRPRPKDRQQIQDRVKELREIVPNSAKCSIDTLLDRTIKHMLYLQSVTKYADKLKQTDEPKMICEESGVVLKDNTSGNGNGATWAFEVAGQTMVCPIIVEDLSPPGQMLVEMLCEERGLFLEIADIIRNFGLTILKGVMEIRDGKIWARFLVEANRDVTRMDIFMSLVQLLQQNTHVFRPSEHQAKLVDRRACDLIVGKLQWQSQSAWPLSYSNNEHRSIAQ